MQNKQAVTEGILRQRMLPLFFHPDPQVSINVTRTLYKAGIRVLEYTNRGEQALSNFSLLKKIQRLEMPDLQLGIGTIKSPEEAQDFIKEGADFVVSPIVNAEVARLVHEQGLLWIPGCMTPTEIYYAQSLEAAIIKVFPANILGPEFISSIKDIFRGQLFIPTGGVELEQNNIHTWFRAGVCAVGIGSKMISKHVLEQQDYDQLARNTEKALQLVHSYKLN